MRRQLHDRLRDPVITSPPTARPRPPNNPPTSGTAPRGCSPTRSRPGAPRHIPVQTLDLPRRRTRPRGEPRTASPRAATPVVHATLTTARSPEAPAQIRRGGRVGVETQTPPAEPGPRTSPTRFGSLQIARSPRPAPACPPPNAHTRSPAARSSAAQKFTAAYSAPSGECAKAHPKPILRCAAARPPRTSRRRHAPHQTPNQPPARSSAPAANRPASCTHPTRQHPQLARQPPLT